MNHLFEMEVKKCRMCFQATATAELHRHEKVESVRDRFIKARYYTNTHGEE